MDKVDDIFENWTHEQKTILSLLKHNEELIYQRNCLKAELSRCQDVIGKIEMLEAKLIMLERKLIYPMLQ